MKVLSLFSGIGAFEKALDNLGVSYELAAYCEIDKYASRSYAAIHGVSEDLNLGDITKVDETALPKDLDLITYGFPCQDISIAGRQKGMIDEDGNQTRSGLFFEALRIIQETQPRVAIAENVKNLTGAKFKEQFALVLRSLNEAGYNNYWKVLNLKDFGIPQNRERVFIVSIRKDVDIGTFTFPTGFPLEKRLKDALEEAVDERYYMIGKAIKGLEEHKDKQECMFDGKPDVMQIGNCCPTKTRDNPNQGRIYDTAGIAPALNCMGGGNRQPCIIEESRVVAAAMRGRYNDDGKVEQHIEVSDREYANTITSVQKDSLACEVVITEPEVLCPERTEYGKAIRKLTPKECFRLMGFSDEDHDKAASVNSNTQLYKQAGNSIGVPCVEYILMALFDCGALAI